jgi:hypothetical protein
MQSKYLQGKTKFKSSLIEERVKQPRSISSNQLSPMVILFYHYIFTGGIKYAKEQENEVSGILSTLEYGRPVLLRLRLRYNKNLSQPNACD